MTMEEAKNYITQHGKEHLAKDKSGKGFVCPICGSGSGPHGTGITTKDGIHFTCWAGCFTNADIIDIIGLETGTTDYKGKLQAAASEYGISIDGCPEYQKQHKSKQHTQSNIHNDTYTSRKEAEPDYTDFFLQAANDIGKTGYHRGLSISTLSRFGVGFVEHWRHPKAPKMDPSPRLIIPTSQHSYLARYAGSGDYINYRGDVENKSKVGKVRVFNAGAIATATTPVFIVEGELDAMSFYEVGAEAIGLGSLSNTKLLIAELEKCRPAAPLIIALDNESKAETRERVEKAASGLAEEFQRLGIPFYRVDVAKPYKDANEALTADREAFRVAVNGAIAHVEDEEAAAEEAEREALKRESTAYALPGFLKSIEESKMAAAIPTGYSRLDAILDGGLYPGLYIIGAISSLGKTTFCLNVADNIAQSGRDVLIFSLEMARNELIAKSISRLTLTYDLAENGTTAHAKTTRGILTGTRYTTYGQTEREIIQKAIARYGEYAMRIYITEGVGNVGVGDIREKVRKHIKLTGTPPVVLIDYLQIIAPADLRATDKQNTDKAVLELKRISRDFSIPVIGISSFNRESYTAPVSMAAFKESGAIEYSSDVLVGLQYDGMDYQEGETDKAREKRIRELMKQAVEDGKAGRPQRIQVKVLKHRNGSKGDAYIEFYPMFNHFIDQNAGERNGESGGWRKSETGYITKTRKNKRDSERGGAE